MFLIRKNIVIIILIVTAFLLAGQSKAQSKATWIWYPGDYEIWLANKMQNRRTDRGTFLPVLWKMDSHYVLVEFHKDMDLSIPDTLHLYTEGLYNVKIDGKEIPGTPHQIVVGKGRHRISLKVYDQSSPPSIFVKGKQVVSDSSWLVTFEDKEWIDASGKASDKSGTVYCKAGYWNFDDPLSSPSMFHLPQMAEYPVSVDRKSKAMLLDFGKETFGFIKLYGISGTGKINIYYGESKEEALSSDSCETLDGLTINSFRRKDSVMPLSKAFRYVRIVCQGKATVDSASMLYEYSPLKQEGSFRCSDSLINKIWDVSAYTLHLNTREFFTDGIKRDRWIWSGDAYQSYLMNYYLFFDEPTVRRTVYALRGKDPVTSHINTIMDYTFYWFMSIENYYLYSGDKSFIRQIYPSMKTLMDFCLSRRNKDGFMEWKPGDWIFIDWAENLSKQGVISFEQILFCKSLETISHCALLMKDTAGEKQYALLAGNLKDSIFKKFWNNDLHALVHNEVNGTPTALVNRYANMFALLLDYLSPSQQEDVKKYVLLNDRIQKITTPYMRFYELEALCRMNEQRYVLQQIKEYWGGMLSRGATTFWEQYDPAQKGAAQYAMYGRPFGKSLCHAWGASPLYLLGKYYLGVQPLAPGYKKYKVEPALGGLEWIEGEVPTPDGHVHEYCSREKIVVYANEGTGTLLFRSTTEPRCAQGMIKKTGDNRYEMTVSKNIHYEIHYKSVK